MVCTSTKSVPEIALIGDIPYGNQTWLAGRSLMKTWHPKVTKTPQNLNFFVDGETALKPYHYNLVGGLVAIFYFPINIGNFIIPIDFHIFQRGGPTTNQTMSFWAKSRGRFGIPSIISYLLQLGVNSIPVINQPTKGKTIP